MKDTGTRGQFTGNLRQLADFLDAHPGVPVPGYERTIQYCAARYEHGGREEVDAIASALGVPVDDDTANGGHYTASRTFGSITYTACAIPQAAMDRLNALDSYRGSVIPDTAA